MSRTVVVESSWIVKVYPAASDGHLVDPIELLVVAEDQESAEYACLPFGQPQVGYTQYRGRVILG